MIITSLEECASQANLSPVMLSAIEFLKSADPASHPVGKIEIDGKQLYAFSQSYSTKECSEVLYEAHRNYIDIQYIISGTELMGWAPIDQINVTQEYDAEGDYLLGAPVAEAAHVPFTAGQVMILYPSDAHAPGIQVNGTTSDIRKIVLKVAIS